MPEPFNPDLIAPGGKVDRELLFSLYEQNEGDDETPVTVQFKLTRDLDKRLDKYLVDRIPFLSRTSLQRLIREESVTVNGRVPKASTKLRKGDEVIAVLPPPPSTAIPAEEIPLHVLYEDDDLIVINKHNDIIVHPARGNRSGTIINALAWHFQHRSSGELSTVGEEFARPGVVHRLDRHTTGVMVAAKSDTAHWRLGHQFEQRKTDKRYLAVVHGQMEPYADVIDLPLGKHPTAKEKYAVRWDATGKPSVTIYRVREVYDDFTLVELELKTGRTHQIRVHLSHIGYPIVGDDMYGGRHLRTSDIVQMPSALSQDAPVISRQALHAASLGFTHPITYQPMRIQAPLHHDMLHFVKLLRSHRFISAPNIAGTTLDLETIIPASA
ncbi:MAG TPA: RluA family pseudouridine synthase [Phycisphaerales bacterium]|nr:RluA family pseudouridine synthase [Phycisphaerales bacterium]HRQ74434.1 RluA family pseudouridine synthase [Phycisphaerales bacterium]